MLASLVTGQSECATFDCTRYKWFPVVLWWNHPVFLKVIERIELSSKMAFLSLTSLSRLQPPPPPPPPHSLAMQMSLSYFHSELTMSLHLSPPWLCSGESQHQT